MKVAVLGAGAFGTGLAIALGQTTDVVLWGRNIGNMASSRENTLRLPDCTLPKSVLVTDDLGIALTSDVLLLAVPMQALATFLEPQNLTNKTVVAVCKGIDLSSGLGPSGLLDNVAIMTGPSFARDIALGLPTALTLACANDELGKRLQNLLARPALRLYRTTDVIGAELGGAIKNVIAIASGAAIGARLGESARAALMTRGFSEMRRYAVSQGARPDTLMGLSGFGDLVLTCTSTQSRNYRFGMALGAGDSFDPNITVEGVATAQALVRHSALDMPICAAVAELTQGRKTVAEAMAELLARPLKQE